VFAAVRKEADKNISKVMSSLKSSIPTKPGLRTALNLGPGSNSGAPSPSTNPFA